MFCMINSKQVHLTCTGLALPGLGPMCESLRGPHPVGLAFVPTLELGKLDEQQKELVLVKLWLRRR